MWLYLQGSLYVVLGRLDNVVFVSVSVYVILGHQDEHLGLMIAMEEMKLFDKGEFTIALPGLFNSVILITAVALIL